MRAGHSRRAGHRLQVRPEHDFRRAPDPLRPVAPLRKRNRFHGRHVDPSLRCAARLPGGGAGRELRVLLRAPLHEHVGRARRIRLRDLQADGRWRAGSLRAPGRPRRLRDGGPDPVRRAARRSASVQSRDRLQRHGTAGRPLGGRAARRRASRRTRPADGGHASAGRAAPAAPLHAGRTLQRLPAPRRPLHARRAGSLEAADDARRSPRSPAPDRGVRRQGGRFGSRRGRGGRGSDSQRSGRRFPAPGAPLLRRQRSGRRRSRRAVTPDSGREDAGLRHGALHILLVAASRRGPLPARDRRPRSERDPRRAPPAGDHVVPGSVVPARPGAAEVPLEGRRDGSGRTGRRVERLARGPWATAAP